MLIHGDGFEPGAIVTLGGVTATEVAVVSSSIVTATSPAHAAGKVDVVVTNSGGQSGRLPGGYTYAVVVAGPAPTIAAVSPDTGTVGGDAQIRITGTGFQPGAFVKLDDTLLQTYAYGSSNTTLNARVPAHAAGIADISVINPDGQSVRLSGGFRYAAPGTLDFNGQWKGQADDLRDNHSGTEIRFTIENNRLVNVTCNGGVEFTMSTPASISNDEFSFLGEDRPLVSGRFLSADAAVGRINFPPCGLTWVAFKQQ